MELSPLSTLPPTKGEEKSFSPKLGEMVRSTREVCFEGRKGKEGQKGKAAPLS